MTEQQPALVKFADIPDGTPFVHGGDVMIKLRLSDPDQDGFGSAWACRDRELRMVSDWNMLCEVYETVREFDPDHIWT